MNPRDLSIEDFTYDLPQEKIAVYPLAERDASKLLVFKDHTIRESVFKNLDSFLDENTVLVFNTTKVIRARLNFTNEKNQGIEIFCLEPAGAYTELSQAMGAASGIQWRCLVGNLKRWKNGDLSLTKEGLTLHAKLVEKGELDVLIEFYWQPTTLCFSEMLEKMGNTPIPPYLKRSSDLADQTRYQTIYADSEGSVAAPTAGLHFTQQVLEKLKTKSVKPLSVTLHVGAGTFKPVKADKMAGHEMHAEWMDVEKSMIRAILENEGAIIAVGTTSLRTLESLYWMGLKAIQNKNAGLADLEIKQWDPYEMVDESKSLKECLLALIDWMDRHHLQRMICHTQILIAPPYELRVAKGIVTNFHQPQSTLLLLISAIVGKEWRNIYEYALRHDFRFLSYGDSSLLLK